MIDEYCRIIKEKCSNGASNCIFIGWTFTGVKYIVDLTETINKNQAEITIINDTHLLNFKTYIGQLNTNQNAIMLGIERDKANRIVANDKMKTMEEKINEMEQDFKTFLIMRSQLSGNN